MSYRPFLCLKYDLFCVLVHDFVHGTIESPMNTGFAKRRKRDLNPRTAIYTA
jgi:hypothetical protein